MLRSRAMVLACWFGLVVLLLPLAFAQDAGVLNPPSTRGPNPLVTGVFVTPVHNAPFSAVVQLESLRQLQDGTTESFKSVNAIARDANGRIRNERRRLVPQTFAGSPPVLSIHIYDPATRISTFLDPFKHIARQSMLQGPAPEWDQMTTFPNVRMPVKGGDSKITQEDLGTQVMENLTVHGVRVTRTIPESTSGTGHPLAVTDEYWYSDDLHLNMMVKHNDPRTGEQKLTITQVKREEPDPQMFAVPSDYKIVDETPAQN